MAIVAIIIIIITPRNMTGCMFLKLGPVHTALPPNAMGAGAIGQSLFRFLNWDPSLGTGTRCLEAGVLAWGGVLR